MTRLYSEEITQKDLVDFIKNESDFSFEMSVLNLLKENKIDCEHGGTYDDSVTGKPRQFDIRALRKMNCDSTIYQVRMAIECKNIRKNYPVIVSCAPRTMEESYHSIAYSKETDSVISMNSPITKHISEGYSIYKVKELVGKNIDQVGRNNNREFVHGDGEFYDKWAQCLSSTNDLVKLTYADIVNHSNKYLYASILPMVIIPNNRLWMAEYSLEGKLVGGPEPTDRCSCFVGRNYEMKGLNTKCTM